MLQRGLRALNSLPRDNLVRLHLASEEPAVGGLTSSQQRHHWQVVGPGGSRLELQLDGCGPTPCAPAGADGRRSLRAALWELLASEALHALGVPSVHAGAEPHLNRTCRCLDPSCTCAQCDCDGTMQTWVIKRAYLLLPCVLCCRISVSACR